MNTRVSEGEPRKISTANYEGEEADLLRRIVDAQSKAPKLKTVDKPNGKQSIELDCEDDAIGFVYLMESLGTSDAIFAETLLAQIGNSTTGDKKVNDAVLNFAVSIVQSIKPRDQLEALLATQMAAVHICAMTASRKYLQARYLKPEQNAERALNRLNRTFALQMEALRKHRNGGKQTVRVEKVLVADGGQAIVGDVHSGGSS